MGDRVAVMSQGSSSRSTRRSACTTSPANLFVAGFIGTPPMNLLEATLEPENGRGPRRRRTSAPAPRRGAPALPRPAAARQDRRRSASAPTTSHAAPSTRAADARPQLELIEALGTESIAYFRIDAHAIRAGADVEFEDAELEADEEAGSA